MSLSTSLSTIRPLEGPAPKPYLRSCGGRARLCAIVCSSMRSRIVPSFCLFQFRRDERQWTDAVKIGILRSRQSTFRICLCNASFAKVKRANVVLGNAHVCTFGGCVFAYITGKFFSVLSSALSYPLTICFAMRRKTAPVPLAPFRSAPQSARSAVFSSTPPSPWARHSAALACTLAQSYAKLSAPCTSARDRSSRLAGSMPAPAGAERGRPAGR